MEGTRCFESTREGGHLSQGGQYRREHLLEIILKDVLLQLS